MDKNVIVSVSGMLFAQGKGGESEDVEVISPGEYHWKNGKHYIRYVEINEEFEEPIMNTLKISPDEVSILKRGLIESTMVFNRGNFTASHYTTPFGTLVMGIRTKDMKVSEEEQKIRVHVDYELEINYEHASDCSISIDIQSGGEQFCIS